MPRGPPPSFAEAERERRQGGMAEGAFDDGRGYDETKEIAQAILAPPSYPVRIFLALISRTSKLEIYSSERLIMH